MLDVDADARRVVARHLAMSARVPVSSLTTLGQLKGLYALSRYPQFYAENLFGGIALHT
jgi:hypothetical protein